VSLNPRLAGLAAPTSSRAAAVADQMVRIRRKHADRVYTHPDTATTVPRASRSVWAGGEHLGLYLRRTFGESRRRAAYVAAAEESIAGMSTSVLLTLLRKLVRRYWTVTVTIARICASV
jgi:hypothetical protein